jgi:hypothetical protein
VDRDLRARWKSTPRTARQYLNGGSARYRAELIAIVLGDHDPPKCSVSGGNEVGEKVITKIISYIYLCLSFIPGI